MKKSIFEPKIAFKMNSVGEDRVKLVFILVD
jgi:hypothetical protein